jgi:glycosyltransferase involved in cell wall biosynthesis
MNATDSLPLVSIGIPTYKRADDYLPQTLESAIRQDYPKLEIIVSDNASPDHTREVVQRYQDPRIRYFRQERNLIPNDNFNFLLQQAAGEYFLLMHDDDLIDPDFVSACIHGLGQKGPVGVIRTGLRVVRADTTLEYQNENEAEGLGDQQFIDLWWEGKSPTFLCNALFNTKYLKEIGGFGSKTNLYQDVVAELELALRFGRADVRAVKASYRRHSENMGDNSKTRAWIEDSHYLLDKLCELLPQADDAFRRKGMYYLCKWNYSRVGWMKSLPARLYGYYVNYRDFQYAYPPYGLIYKREIRAKIGIKRWKALARKFFPKRA